MLLERGIVVSYETIHCWAKKFGPDYAGRLQRKSASPNDVWHLDEVVLVRHPMLVPGNRVSAGGVTLVRHAANPDDGALQISANCTIHATRPREGMILVADGRRGHRDQLPATAKPTTA